MTKKSAMRRMFDGMIDARMRQAQRYAEQVRQLHGIDEDGSIVTRNGHRRHDGFRSID